jgi:hypothetical protein
VVLALLVERLTNVSRMVTAVQLRANFANKIDFIFLQILSVAYDRWIYPDIARGRFSYSYWKGQEIIPEQGGDVSAKRRVGVPAY